MKTKLISRIAYSDVYKSKVSVKSLIAKINTESSIEILALINKNENDIYYKYANGELNFILHEWLALSDSFLKNKIFNCYNDIREKRFLRNSQETDFSNIKIINKTATLRCIEILISQSNIKNIKDVDEKESLENLFKLYLLTNDEIANRQDILFKEWMPIPNKRSEIRFHLYLGLSHIDLTSYSLSKRMWTEAMKLVQFEKWMKHENKYNEVLKVFLENTGSKDLYDFFSKIFLLNNVAIEKHKISEETYKDLWKILEYFSSHIGNTQDWTELVGIKKMPLYKLTSKEYLILDIGFLFDKIFSGIYYDLIELSKKTPKSSFHLDYSKKFVENVLLENSLKTVFAKAYIQLNEERFKKINRKNIDNLAIPDFYIRNGNKTFVFECKNSYLSHSLKLSLDCKEIEEDIKNKFFDSKGKKKAVKQLLNFIKISNGGKYKEFDTESKLSRLNYYPILVVTDNTLTSIGFNKLFNEYFNEELEEIEKNLSSRIKPLTIIHIDDLFYYGEKLKKIDLLINEYHKYVSKNSAIDSMISFTTFLETNKLSGKIQVNKKNVEHIFSDSILEN